MDLNNLCLVMLVNSSGKWFRVIQTASPSKSGLTLVTHVCFSINTWTSPICLELNGA